MSEKSCNAATSKYTTQHSDIAGILALPEICSACEDTLLFQSRSLRPVFNAILRYVAPVVFFCAPATAAIAQSPAAGSNWDHLKALPVHTRLHVSADKMSHTCYLLSVDDAALVCGRYTFPRAEVKSVKLTRYGVSYGVGAGIGAGVGAGIGVAAVSGGDGFFANDKGKAAGIGLALGAGIGALIAGPADLFRGPTVYRRQ